MRNALILPVMAILWVIVTSAAPTPVQSQMAFAPDTADYPTVTALDAANIPIADPIALAQRFRGVTDIRPTNGQPDFEIGQQRTFWVSQLGTDILFQVEAELRVSGETIYFWIERGAQVDENALRELTQVFDSDIYQQVRDLWGSEASPGIDGDTRIHALLAYNLGSGIAAYYGSRHSYPQSVVPSSNEMEMFFINLTAFPDVGNPFLYNTLAHEFQHMIRANVDPNEDSWMDEGYSTFTELILGFGNPNNTAAAFISAPGTQLNTWAVGDAPTSPHYGASLLLITYLYEQFGPDAISVLSADPRNGLPAVAGLLADQGGPELDTLFADWVLANYFQASLTGGGRYDYRLLDGQLNHPASTGVMAYPFEITRESNQYATDYYRLAIPLDATAFDVTIDVPAMTSLVPVQAASGQWMWYSNRGDGSNPMLTRLFDLSGVDSATLTFKVWHNIETGWDYGYVSASRDGGATWTILPATGTTDFDPQSNSYGMGYTGESGKWIDAQANLDAFAGDTVLVRFEMVTDDAVNQPGMLVDDIAIPQIGYFSDFENSGGGWMAEGWVRIDNVLPQQVWVQAAQLVNGDVTVTRILTPVESTLRVPVIAGSPEVLVTVSPFAPVTTVPAAYTLKIDAR